MNRHAMLVGTAVAATMLAIAGVGCSHKLDTGASSSEVNASNDARLFPIISQVYPGNAGGEGAFVELFNPTGKTIPGMSNYAVQWAAGDRDFAPTSLKELKDLDLPGDALLPGQHLLVKVQAPQPVVGGGGSAGADSLPTAAAGKVTIVTTQALAQGCVADAGAECTDKNKTTDYVGWGSATFVPTEPTANAPAASLKEGQALLRATGGCQNTTNNAADFAAGEPKGLDVDAPATPCAQPDAGTDGGTAPADAGPAPAPPLILLNEIKIRQGASNTWGFTEIACTKSLPLIGLSYVEIDAKGVALRVIDLTKEKCGGGPADKTTGILLIAGEGGTESLSADATVVRVPAVDPAAKPSTFLLVYSAPGKVALPVEGTSYDPAATGKLALPPGSFVWDSIAVTPDASTARYAKAVVVKQADAISRPYYSAGTVPVWNDSAQWFGGALKDGDEELFYDAAKATKNIPQDVFALTPGTSNIAPDVTDVPEETVDKPAAPAAPTKTTNNPQSAKIAESAASVCSMTSGPRGSGHGFLAAVAAVASAVVARRKKR